MPQASYAGADVEVDGEGFLVDATAWNEDIGRAIAEQAGITLTEDHWKVINFARTDFRERGQSPGPRRITSATGVPTKSLYQLFPKGPGKLVAKIAGVPKPKTCL